MKNFKYSRFFKNLLGSIFIISLTLSILGGIILIILGNIFSSSDISYDSYYETTSFKNDFYDEAVNILHHIDNTNYYGNYEDIGYDTVAINLIDYKTGNSNSYTYSYLEKNINNLHIPYSFSISSSTNESTDIVLTDNSSEVNMIDYSSSIKSTDAIIINDSSECNNSYYILSGSDYSNLIMKYGLKNGDGQLFTEFSTDSYIYENNSCLLVYSPDENIFFSTQDGWFTNNTGLLFNAGEVSAYGNIEEGLLLTQYEDYYNTADTILSDFYSYNESINYFNNEIANSDLIFYISGFGLSTTYSNVSEYTDVVDNSSYYFFYNKETNVFDTNLNLNSSSFSDYVPNKYHASGVIAFGLPSNIDNTTFNKNQFLFDYALTNYKLIIAAAIISIILTIASFATLISITGRGAKEDTSITLYRFDNTFTEITTIIFAVSIFAFTFAIIAFTDYVNPRHIYWGYEVIGIILAMVTAEFVAMSTVLSLVRLFKTSRLIKQSLIRKTFLRLKKFIKIFIEGKTATFRTGLAFTVFLVIFVILLLCISISAYRSEMLLCFVFVIIFCMVLLFGGALQIYEAYGLAKITTAVKEIADGNLDYKIATATLNGQQAILAKNINNIGEGLQSAIETSVKDERLKAELITNVSHDIKTPLTSIINYVDLLKRENIEDETILHYIDVLDQKSNRLKYLTEALVEASKVTTGNIELNFVPLNFTELLNQTIGEFEDKFSEVNLTVIASIATENTVIYADGQRTYRILENLFQNIYKYAMPGTRVYVDLTSDNDNLNLSIKNISNHQLNISPEELTERFIRGDESRTTEGSGLGLSISKDLTELQNGTFNIQLDGDLFKIIITFKLYNPSDE